MLFALPGDSAAPSSCWLARALLFWLAHGDSLRAGSVRLVGGSHHTPSKAHTDGKFCVLTRLGGNLALALYSRLVLGGWARPGQ